MGIQVERAFDLLRNGHDRYEIHDIHEYELDDYDREYKTLAHQFYQERVFTEERIVCRHELQADPFYIKYQDKILFGSLALVIGYLVYRYARPLFIDMKEAQAIYNKCTYYEYRYMLPFIMGGRGFFTGGHAPFIGTSFSPSSIRNGFIMMGVIGISLPLGLAISALVVPLNPSRNLYQMTFTKEAHPLENDKREGQYVCPLSGELLSPEEVPLPIRFNNQLFKINALVSSWLERGLIPEEQEEAGLHSEVARIVNITEPRFWQILEYNLSIEEAAERAIDRNGKFTEIALNALRLTQQRANDFDTRIQNLIEHTMTKDDQAMRQIFNRCPAFRNLRIDYEQPWDDTFFQIEHGIGHIRTTMTVNEQRLTFNPTCYVFSRLMASRIDPQDKEAFHGFLLRKKKEEFRKLKVNLVASKLTPEILHPHVVEIRKALFTEATGVDLGQILED